MLKIGQCSILFTAVPQLGFSDINFISEADKQVTNASLLLYVNVLRRLGTRDFYHVSFFFFL